jgi:glycosyltransferase involved in cell wall biosynthesis
MDSRELGGCANQDPSPASTLREQPPSAGYLLTVNWPVSATGGVNEVILSLAQQLRAQAAYNPVIAVTSWDYSPQPSLVRDMEIVNLRLRPPFVPGKGLWSFAAFLATLAADMRALAAFVRDRRIEVINAHFPDLNAYAVLLMKTLGLFRGKLLLSFHGADIVAISQTRGFHRAAWRNLITRADRAVTCSEAMARDVLHFAPRARVVTIHNGMDVHLFGRNPRIRYSRRRILHIGKFEHKKAHDVLLQAFQLLLESVPDAFLVLVGATGPELAHVRALVSALGLEHKVEIHIDVPHERVPEFMDRADVFVLPSRSEPFGIVMLEAGAAGLPVVATRVGGVPELIEDGETGLLVPPDDAIGLERAIRLLLTDAAAADRLALAWHERVLSNWSWEQTCRKYLDAIGTCA